MTAGRAALAALLAGLPLCAGLAADAAPPAAPASAEAEAWAVALELPPRLPAGAPAVALVRLTARAGHHVNLEYPASFKPAADATVTFSGARVALAVREPAPGAGRPGETCQVALALPFTPGAARPRLAGTVAFSVCSADRCLIERVALSAGAAGPVAR